MPPAISDEESSGSEAEAIPFKKANAKGAEDEEMLEGDDNGEEAEDDEEEEAADEYVVEKILDHAFDADGVLKFEVKWLGYEKKSDRTWEPEENLEGAKDILEAYFKKIGGRPTAPSKSKDPKKRKLSQGASATPEAKGSGRGRKKSKNEEDSGTPEVKGSAKGKKGKPDWEPPPGSWEDEIMSVDSVEEGINPTTGQKDRHAFIMWNNGRKTRHKLHTVYQKCPQKMLLYYEQHLVFKNVPNENELEANGEDTKAGT